MRRGGSPSLERSHFTFDDPKDSPVRDESDSRIGTQPHNILQRDIVVSEPASVEPAPLDAELNSHRMQPFDRIGKAHEVPGFVANEDHPSSCKASSSFLASAAASISFARTSMTRKRSRSFSCAAVRGLGELEEKLSVTGLKDHDGSRNLFDVVDEVLRDDHGHSEEGVDPAHSQFTPSTGSCGICRPSAGDRAGATCTVRRLARTSCSRGTR